MDCRAGQRTPAAPLTGSVLRTNRAPDLKTLHAKIGQLALKNDF